MHAVCGRAERASVTVAGWFDPTCPWFSSSKQPNRSPCPVSAPSHFSPPPTHPHILVYAFPRQRILVKTRWTSHRVLAGSSLVSLRRPTTCAYQAGPPALPFAQMICRHDITVLSCRLGLDGTHRGLVDSPFDQIHTTTAWYCNVQVFAPVSE